ncbi:hypothetical protein CHS0354_017333 [Potamilus streckersoni]|uniref:Uncharacterized protein n=1 Tax=Potamilus streckersoni TaxID=2493646 RepID=A0AAE0W813_9BIVA|nr:hypothetical protein CHS0354_017333 [Potamilus streckersoni]
MLDIRLSFDYIKMSQKQISERILCEQHKAGVFATAKILLGIRSQAVTRKVSASAKARNRKDCASATESHGEKDLEPALRLSMFVLYCNGYVR